LHDDAERRQRIFDYSLVRKRVDAVIAVGISLTSNEVASLQALGKPIVGIDGDIPAISTLSIDDSAAARFLTEHLLSLGHTRIVHIGGNQDEQMDFAVHARQLGIAVPAQLSVVGIDGHSLAEMFGLTTLEQHPTAQGDRAVRLILARLAPEAGTLDPERITMPVDFVVRGSTTAPPAPVT
jgi:DNA-binding LacI/PurR family transcriptional regulator